MSDNFDEVAAIALAPPLGCERWVNGLIGVGHYLSHFYALALPPLFPLLKAEFGVSYVYLGLAMTAYVFLGGVLQAPIGFLVDRLGPRRVLLAGLGLNAAAILCMGFVETYEVLLLLAVLAGLGNSVFHPADYAILSGSISTERLSRAYSIHTFSGFFGGACAPAGMLALASWFDWRVALIVVGTVGLVVWALMLIRRDILQGEGEALVEKEEDLSSGNATAGLGLLLSPTVLLFLLFFILYGMVSGGLTAFIVSALVNLQGVGLDTANTVLTGYLFGVVGGILLGGFIAEKFSRHMVIVTGAHMVIVASVILPAVVMVPGAMLVVMLVITGIGMGAVLTPRDLMIRAFTPPGESGKVFGFIFVGYSIGGGVVPVLFGWFLDHDQAAMIFVMAALFALGSLAAVAMARWVMPKR